MKRICLFIALFLATTTVDAQEIACDFEDIKKEVYVYLLAHLDSVKKYVEDPAKEMIVEIHLNDHLQFDKLVYRQEDTFTLSLWPEMDSYFMNSYEFCPTSILHYESNQLMSEEFPLYFTKKSLKLALKELEEFDYKEWKASQVKTIEPNANFTISFNQLNDGAFYIANDTILGTLDYLNSKPIKIGKNYYIHFDVVYGSEGGIPSYTLNYNIFKIIQKKYKLVFEDRGVSNYKGVFSSHFSQGDFLIDVKFIFEP